VVIAYLKVGDRIVDRRVLDEDSTRGESYEPQWRIFPGESSDDCRDCLAIGDGDYGNLAIGVGTGVSKRDDTKLQRFENELSYRVEKERLELLTPGRGSRLVETERGTVRRRADTSDIIEIEAQGT
jgi:hypothetical protein